MVVLERQSRNLRQTRDLLLPRLLSGQLELPQAEADRGGVGERLIC